MRNLKGNRAVDEAVFETVHNVVGDAVHRAGDFAVCDVVFWPVYRAVGDAATWAMFDSRHPALQDFLRSADVKTGVV